MIIQFLGFGRVKKMIYLRQMWKGNMIWERRDLGLNGNKHLALKIMNFHFKLKSCHKEYHLRLSMQYNITLAFI